MASQEAPSTREIAEYVDNTEFADDSGQTTIPDNVENTEIALLAYQFWQSRGCPLWSDQEDWFNAERELKTNGHRDPGVAAS